MGSSTTAAARVDGGVDRARRSRGRWRAGDPGAFGGKLLTSWPVWLGLSAVFLLGLVDIRRPLSLRTLDLLVLLSFGVSLAFFNRGEVFQSAALAVPPLVYLLVRTAWIGFRGDSTARRASAASRWPVWLLAGGDALPRRLPHRAQRQGGAPRDRRRLRGRDRRRPDPRRAGAVRRDARRPTSCPPCGAPTRTARSASGSSRTAAASRPTPAATRTGRSPTSPTSRPCSAFGWSGRWDELPAAHATAIAFDLLVLARARARRPALRRRPARRRPRLRLGRVSVHDLRARREHERRDHARGARLGLLARARRRPRAAPRVALASWTKFAALLLAPLWLGVPVERAAAAARCASRPASRVATVAAFSILLLEPSLADAVADVLGPDARLPARARLAVLDLGLGPVPRARHPRSRLAADRRPGVHDRARGRGRRGARARRARSSSPRSPRRCSPRSSSR